jgi:hypothetical protein
MNYNIYYTNCYILLKEIVMIIIVTNYEVNFFLPPPVKEMNSLCLRGKGGIDMGDRDGCWLDSY